MKKKVLILGVLLGTPLVMGGAWLYAQRARQAALPLNLHPTVRSATDPRNLINDPAWGLIRCDEILVKFRSGVSTANVTALAERWHVHFHKEVPSLPVWSVIYPTCRSLESLRHSIEILRTDNSVEEVGPSQVGDNIAF